MDIFLNYDLVVKGSEYAKYYFILCTLAEDMRNEAQSNEEKANVGKKLSKAEQWALFPLLKPICADQMIQL